MDPVLHSPASAGVYRPWLEEGFARPGARRTGETFEIAATCHLQITGDERAALDAMKPYAALYTGGMGAKEQTFHKAVFEQMGYEVQARTIQELDLAGPEDEAALPMPLQDLLVAEAHSRMAAHGTRRSPGRSARSSGP